MQRHDTYDVRRYFDVSHANGVRVLPTIYTPTILYIKRKGGRRGRDKESDFACPRVETGVRGTDFPGAPNVIIAFRATER